MNGIRRIISLILSAAMFSIPNFTANAADWVTVSSWAYNDVSNFTKEGLLPDSFEEVTDYTQSITRLQFAELVYSVMKKTRSINDDNRGYISFHDTKSETAHIIASYGIMEGDTTYETEIVKYYGKNGEIEEEHIVDHVLFYPDRFLTREETAVVLYRIARRFCPQLLKSDNYGAEWTDPPKDFDKVSVWAKDYTEKVIRSGIVSGMEDRSFCPKDSLSIEQAVTLLYRIYNALPTAASADGADVYSDTEQLIQTYSNGIVETKLGNMLYIKSADANIVLMEFETDIYSNIYCSTHDGIPYAAAQNLSAATDVYNLNTKELLFKIPYPTYSADSEYITVKSSNMGPFTFGLYDYGGNELFAPVYSLSELEEIKANNMEIPQEEFQAANGWIYYSDCDDDRRLYRIDSNGENKQKLSDSRVFDIEYANGWLFYHVNDWDTAEEWHEFPVYCMRADGGTQQRLTGGGGTMCEGKYMEYKVSESDMSGYSKFRGGRDMYSVTVYNPNHTTLCHDGEWIYYCEKDDEGSDSLWRVSVSGDNIKREEICEGILADTVQYKDGTVYFKRVDTSEGERIKSVYSFDGGAVKKLSGDLDVAEYGFMDDKLFLNVIDDNPEYSYMGCAVYTADTDGSNAEINPEIAGVRRKYRENPKKRELVKDIAEIKGMSDDKYFLYNILEVVESADSYETRETFMSRDSDGNERVIGIDLGFPQTRIENVLYFIKRDITQGKDDRSFWAYDLDAGEGRTVAGNVKDVDYRRNAAGEAWFNFTDYNFNICRYNTADDSVTVVFPNNNLHRYGRVQRMLGMDNGMYKVDTDGNYSFITGDTAEGCIYAENGAVDAMRF